MNWDATTAISTLIISIITLLTFIVVLRKYYKRVKVEREAKHQELIATIKAQTTEKLEAEKKLDDRFWEIEESRKECKNSREKETNEKFNMIEKNMDLANEKNKSAFESLTASVDELRNDMNKSNEKIESVLENMQKQIIEILKNLNLKPVRKKREVKKPIIKKS